MVTLVQLEYIVAVDTYRHFATAAEKCFITQPTLSMQIKKLEDDLGVLIFDRSHQPVTPTKVGYLIIEQARKLLREHKKLQEIVDSFQGRLHGQLRIGIIPTLGPYLLPDFIGNFSRKYPDFQVAVKELKTSEILTALKKDQLDVGLLVTPVNDEDIEKKVLFYEEILVYMSKQHPFANREIVSPESLSSDSLWLLSEGHCFRGQMVNICQLQQEQISHGLPINYESGSLETLRKLVEKEGGYTLLPELALTDARQNDAVVVKQLSGEKPLREVSLVFIKDFAGTRLLDILAKEITQVVPSFMRNGKRGRIVDWH